MSHTTGLEQLAEKLVALSALRGKMVPTQHFKRQMRRRRVDFAQKGARQEVTDPERVKELALRERVHSDHGARVGRGCRALSGGPRPPAE